jgi:UDP-2,3-diacylglucosamine hydrolase
MGEGVGEGEPMAHTLFISDLHLCDSRPHINRLFFDFLNGAAVHAESLYILGDLFEYWIGDDDIDTGLNGQVVRALAALSDHGTKVYFMHGNRDFLIGARFAEEAKLTILPDPTLVDLYGRRTLLMHGDTLCTGDVDYQRFRSQVRSAQWQHEFLAQPLHERRKEVETLRKRSEEAKRAKPMEIMDVAPGAAEDTLRKFGYPWLIHGHTHRPARHIHAIDGKQCQRWVLSDWYVKGDSLECSAQGWSAHSIA